MQPTVPELARQNEAVFHHSMKRRCFVHDYKGRSIYLITLEVAGRRRLLGRIATALQPAHRTGPAHRTVTTSRQGRYTVGLVALCVSPLNQHLAHNPIRRCCVEIALMC